MSRSCFCQHMEQRGIVGKGCHIEGNQTLVTHSVHPFFPLFDPVLLFPISSFPHAPPSPHTTIDVVPGQQALDSQCVLILHCLPQALVLQGREKMWHHEREILKKNKWSHKWRVRVKPFFHEATKGFDAKRIRFNVTGHITQIMNQSLINETEVTLAQSACRLT